MSATDHVSAWLDLTQQAVSSLDPKTRTVEAFWKKGLRSDGRLFAESRPYTIQHGILSRSAVGSALVQCGGTRRVNDARGGSSSTTIHATDTTSQTIVMAAVTLLVGQPSPLAPNQGDIVVTLTPLGATTLTAQSTTLAPIQSFVQRILEENVDLEQLLLVEGKIAYRLSVALSILVSDRDGVGLLDVSLAAAVAALLDTRLPVRPLISEGIVSASNSDETVPLRMPIVPCALTAASARFMLDTDSKASNRCLQHYWMVDPHADEHDVATGRATVVVNAVASTDESVLALQWCPTAHHGVPQWPTIATSHLAQLVPMAMSHAHALSTVLPR